MLPAVERIVADVRKQRRSRAAALRGAVRRACRRDAAARHAGGDGRGWEAIDPALREALKTAAAADSRICRAADARSRGAVSPIAGLTTGQLVRPLGSVGCYVPSGRHPLPSTLLMTAIPAQVAGVERIVVVSPKPAPETLAAAHLLGITEFYRLGGAHAIAALAYGTASDCARRQDCRPGQSLCHRGQAPRRLRLRHRHARRPDGDCRHQRTRRSRPRSPPTSSRRPNTILRRSPSSSPRAMTLRNEVIAEAKLRSRNNPVAREALERNGLVIVAANVDEARAITNRLAPEHLTVDSASDLDWVAECRLGVCRPLVRAADGRLHLRPESHAAHRRHGARARRPQRQRLRQAHHRAGIHGARHCARLGRRRHCWPRPKDSSATPKRFARDCARASRRSEEAPWLKRIATVQLRAPRARVQAMKEYHPPLGSRDALRLDFNENTLACSPQGARSARPHLRRRSHALSRA